MLNKIILINNCQTVKDLKILTTELLESNYKHCIKSEYMKAAHLYKYAHDIIKSFFDSPQLKIEKEYKIIDLKESIDLIKQDLLFCRENGKKQAVMIYSVIINLLEFTLWNSL